VNRSAPTRWIAIDVPAPDATVFTRASRETRAQSGRAATVAGAPARAAGVTTTSTTLSWTTIGDATGAWPSGSSNVSKRRSSIATSRTHEIPAARTCEARSSSPSRGSTPEATAPLP